MLHIYTHNYTNAQTHNYIYIYRYHSAVNEVIDIYIVSFIKITKSLKENDYLKNAALQGKL